MQPGRLCRWLILGLCLGATAGCGAGGTGRLAVSGEVVFQGQPLDQGTIQFLTTQGPAGGAMIRAGRYQVPEAHGLSPGTYRVVISAAVPARTVPPDWKGSSPPTEERIPAAYSSPEKSTKTVEVTPEGPNVFNFTIE